MAFVSYPEEVVIEGAEEAASTPLEEEDFFSSWDKPSIKRPTPPPTRTATPPIIGRTGSPALTPGGSNGNGTSRPKSPFNPSAATTPPVSRTTTSSALRTKAGGAATGGARKTGILGAKKATKLGAKKTGGAIVDDFDFDAAEKKAKEEAERIQKLGYDPEAEKAKEEETKSKQVVIPEPSSSSKHVRKSSDVERLGLGVARLGFGQTASTASAAAGQKRMGFGSVGPKPAAKEGMLLRIYRLDT